VFRVVSHHLRECPTCGGASVMMLKPTREELLECWITLFKTKDALLSDPADEQLVLSVLDIVNRLQKEALHDRH
jgi:hypothetical protein